jgi:hypothetical protein
MTRPPPEDRPSARELAAQGDRREEIKIAGKPADLCPYCGCAMFAAGTRSYQTTIRRYVHCRNSSCGKRFISSQPPATLVREIEDEPEETEPTIRIRVG